MNTGGHAFPQDVGWVSPNSHVEYRGPQGGMTLRDYFAAKAMQGLICEFLEDFKKTKTKKEKNILKEEFADACYGVADEMLKARKNETQ